MENNKIYILQLHTRTIPAILIKFITRYEYSHIAISFTKDCEEIYSFGRKKLNNIFDSGFITEKKDGPFFKKFNKATCRIYELDVTQKQYDDLEKIISDIKSNENKYKYDFIGMGLRFFRIPASFKNKYVCSYFIADILDKANIYKFEKKNFFVEPRDFETISNSKIIYEGSYKDINFKNVEIF